MNRSWRSDARTEKLFSTLGAKHIFQKAILSSERLISQRTHFIASSHRVCLILAAVELVAVIKDVLVGGVQAGFDTVLHNLTGSGGRLQLLDLDIHTERVRNSHLEERAHNGYYS